MFEVQRRTYKIMESLGWYHGNISRHMSEALLIANGKEGSFLLRSVDDGLCLSVRETLLKTLSNQAILCGQAADLTKNYELGTLLTLKYPYPNKVEEPDSYDETMTLHSTVHSSDVVSNRYLNSRVVPLASKSGFLTKQGGNVKSWKLRWFVIVRNEMSYFEDRASDRPIRILNLEECISVGLCNIPGKEDCFYLEFPDRTWNFSAGSAKEVNDWTSIIQWKLKQNKSNKQNNTKI